MTERSLTTKGTIRVKMAKIEKDWDAAYANAASISDAQSYIDKWLGEAEKFRNRTSCQLDIRYGESERNALDLFHPDHNSRGLFIFIHGGYWYRFDKSFWSHLAAGPLALGWHVAMPSYTLTPEARVPDITSEISLAVLKAAELVDGPIVLAGHSAGGHLVTRQICSDTQLDSAVLNRVSRVISISGVHDLRPITRLEINKTIGLSKEEAESESPTLRQPYQDGVCVDCIVGGAELPEFRRQNALLANVWTGLGARTSCHEIDDKHHFNVIEDMQDEDGLICGLLEQSR